MHKPCCPRVENILVLRLVGLLGILVTPRKSPRKSFIIAFTKRELSLLCIDVGALWEEDELLGLLLLDTVVEVKHGVNDLDILRPVPLDEDVPGHCQHPADARDPSHPVLHNSDLRDSHEY